MSVVGDSNLILDWGSLLCFYLFSFFPTLALFLAFYL